LADPTRAMGYVSRGLLEIFQKSGLDLLNIINKDNNDMEKNMKNLLLNSKVLKKYHNNEEHLKVNLLEIKQISTGEYIKYSGLYSYVFTSIYSMNTYIHK
jgi:hypothetical protein